MAIQISPKFSKPLEKKFLQNSKRTFSLRDNLELGEEMLYEFNKRFGKVKSSTKFSLRFKDKLDNPHYDKVSNYLVDISNITNRRIHLLRIYLQGKYQNVDKYINNLQFYSKKLGNVMNCGEMSDFIQFKFLKRNIPANRRAFEIMNIGQKNMVYDHCFTVIGAKENNSPIPKEWGSKAVIVDTWAKIVAPAQEAIQHYKSLYKFNKHEQEIIYKNANRYNVDTLLNNIRK